MKNILLLCLIFSFSALNGQITLTGACFDAMVTLPEVDPGPKPSYAGTGTVSSTPVTISINWDGSFPPSGAWLLSIEGQPVFYSTDDTATPPATGSGTWQVGDPQCGMTPPTVGGPSAFTMLPVELISFQAKVLEGDVQLEWETATELNNEGFEIQRSRDPFALESSWDRLGFVDGNGTTHETQTYHFLDRGPLNGANYYRLKQIDWDGTYEFTEVKTVKVNLDQDLTGMQIFPNPAKDQLNIKMLIGEENPHQDLEIRLIDINGKTFKYWKTNFIGQSLDLSDVPEGLFFLEIWTATNTWTEKVVIK